MTDDNYCHKGKCCGPGSWCCERAGEHLHDEILGPFDPPYCSLEALKAMMAMVQLDTELVDFEQESIALADKLVVLRQLAKELAK